MQKYNKEFKISDMLEPFKKMYCSSEVRLSCPNSLKKITLETFDNHVSKNPNFTVVPPISTPNTYFFIH